MPRTCVPSASAWCRFCCSARVKQKRAHERLAPHMPHTPLHASEHMTEGRSCMSRRQPEARA
eukprot:6193687-Pleurochrysis_carterae.AAC.2